MNGHPNSAFLVAIFTYAALAAASLSLAAEQRSLFTFTARRTADTDRSSIEMTTGLSDSITIKFRSLPGPTVSLSRHAAPAAGGIIPRVLPMDNQK